MNWKRHMLIDEQRYVHEKIMESIGSDDDGFFFLYGYGGIAKTLYETLSAVVRSKGLIVLNVASSGIVTLLLPGGRIAHSTLTVPIEIMRHHCLRWKRIVLGQTWQILPVVRKGTRQDIVDASINSSNIWAYFNMLRLTINMRLGV
ncbi:PIF1-like helicase [Medicago truncatula]|uniref:ATP-dependent DNA helicase n=1 Tax=Medicago truncatula TaxID=3880 RepID=A0A072TS19_MEDTR|nr:PIF1-like helicase [Medicago truncatula]